MHSILKIIPLILYFIVGLISLSMSIKTLFSKKFLPFHEKASGIPWEEIDHRLKQVILAMLRLSGLGFLIVALLLTVMPIVTFYNPDSFFTYAIPLLGLFFCTGLFAINFKLYRNTGSETPWRESLYAMSCILAGIVLSLYSSGR
jgi:hypothetical protein